MCVKFVCVKLLYVCGWVSVLLLCVCVLVLLWRRRREEEAGRRPGYRIKNKNPPQRCGESSSVINRFIRPFTHSFIDSFVCSLIHWFADHWFSEKLIHWFIDSLTHWFIDSLIRWFVGSLIRCFIVSSLINLLIHFFIGSLSRWLVYWTDSLIDWNTILALSILCSLINRFMYSVFLFVDACFICFNASLIQRFIRCLIHELVDTAILLVYWFRD